MYDQDPGPRPGTPGPMKNQDPHQIVREVWEIKVLVALGEYFNVKNCSKTSGLIKCSWNII